KQHIERQAQRITLNLNVAFLHDVEQSNLDLAGKIRKFVDRENAAIGAWQQSVVNRQFVRKVAAPPRRTNRINVADDVRNRHVGCRQLFDIPLVARQPGDRRIVTFGGYALPARPADGLQRAIIDFATRDDGNFGVEKLDQSTQDAALRLAAQTQQDEIMPREQRVYDLRQNRVFIAMNTREQRFVALDAPEQIAANLALYGD